MSWQLHLLTVHYRLVCVTLMLFLTGCWFQEEVLCSLNCAHARAHGASSCQKNLVPAS
jgi:hypothetical protein